MESLKRRPGRTRTGRSLDSLVVENLTEQSGVVVEVVYGPPKEFTIRGNFEGKEFTQHRL